MRYGFHIDDLFALHYDLEDDWMFTIIVQNISETSEKIAPNVIKGVLLLGIHTATHPVHI